MQIISVYKDEYLRDDTIEDSKNSNISTYTEGIIHLPSIVEFMNEQMFKQT